MFIDNLPSAVILRDKNNRELEPNYREGIPVGVFDREPFNDRQRILVYNHLDMTVLTHTTFEGQRRIVGFEVEPFSMAEDENRDENNPFKSSGPLYLNAGEKFRFSYRIITRVSLKMLIFFVGRP